MHGYCVSPYSCSDNGSITPIGASSPDFGFKASPNSGTVDDFDLVVLIPNSVAGAFAETITVTGSHTGVTIPVTLTLVSNTAWTSGQLDSYLGISGSPSNPIGAFQPLTATYQPAATGYAVYKGDFGQVTFGTHSDPRFSTLFDFPLGTVITAYSGKKSCDWVKINHVKTLVCSESWTATANSGALMITTNCPEPASLSLIGAGIVGLGFLRRKKVA